MSEKYKKLIKQSAKKNKQMKLIIKNGIRYTITIESDRKPKYKTFKKFNVKKWIIKDVRLISFDIINKLEIAAIIKKDRNEQKAYDRCFQMSKDSLYLLMLSNNQYAVLTKFLDKYKINIGDSIAMTRKGIGFNTRIVFDKILTKAGK